MPKEFNKAQEQGPLSIRTELEAMAPVLEPKVEFEQGYPPARVWLLNEEETELYQLQHDVFACNWRRHVPSATYPRYSHVRSQFEKGFRAFTSFAEENQLGEVSPLRCEVSYVNHLPAGEGWEKFGELHKVLSGCSFVRPSTFLPEAEEIRLLRRFAMRDDTRQFRGRLTVSANPAFRKPDKHPLVVLTLTARGAPISPGIEGVLGFFDLGREWIVRGFVDLTTEEMHRIWGLK